MRKSGDQTSPCGNAVCYVCSWNGVYKRSYIPHYENAYESNYAFCAYQYASSFFCECLKAGILSTSGGKNASFQSCAGKRRSQTAGLMSCIASSQSIPDSPINITITYNIASKEYVFNIHLAYKSVEYLSKKMDHEIVLRKEGTPWPNCEEKTNKIGPYKMCFGKIKDDPHVPERNLEYSTKYEARVRSIPTGGYYDGFWSPWSAITTFQTENNTETDGENTYTNPLYHSTIPVALSISIPFFLLILVIVIAIFWKSRIKPFIWPEIPDHKNTLEKFCNKPKQNIHLTFNPDYYEIIPINKIDYIRAQVNTEDNYEIGTTDSNMEKPAVNACNTNLSPAEGSSGFPTHANNTGQCKNPADNGENTLKDALNSGTVALLHSSNISEKCNPSNGSHGIMSVAVKPPGNGLKGLCWEEIYIAMPVFKTPGSDVKQVPKNTQDTSRDPSTVYEKY
ncbi:interleukin-7 receptor subunit alpha [Rhinoderma darwinii]|uniref:interleukin-7 receptor subunit alpha n=1 Tax=Rhinoderma darwinii TaxID=43563 RepID=UPI003F665F1D